MNLPLRLKLGLRGVLGALAFLGLPAPSSTLGHGPRISGQWQVIVPHRPYPLFHEATGVGVDRYQNVYIADLIEGRIKRFSRGGSLTASWPTPQLDPVRYWHPTNFAVDTAGNSYLLAHGVTKYSPSGTTLAHWTIGQAAISIATGGSGNVFLLSAEQAVVKAGQQPSGNARIDKISPQGKVLSTWRTPVLHQKAVVPDGLAIDTGGNAYVTVGIDNDCYRFCLPVTSFLYRFSSAGMLTSTVRLHNNSSGPVLAVDRQGAAYLMPHDGSFLSSRLIKLSPNGRVLATITAVGRTVLGDMLHMAISGRGVPYLSDSHVANQGLWADSGVVRMLGPKLRERAQSGRILHQRTLSAGLSLTANQAGSLIYYSGGQDGSLYKVVTPAGKLVRAVGSTRGPHIIAAETRAIAVDRVGNVYINDSINAAVLKFSPGGKLLARWRLPPPHNSLPNGLALDRQGYIYVLDPGSIVKLSPRGKVVAVFGSIGREPGHFSAPLGLTIDPRGNIWVADTQAYRIQELAPNGTVLRVWGDERQFDRPTQVALDPRGNVWVTDLTHSYIEEFTPSGKLVKIVGAFGVFPGQFIEPTGMAFDARGTFYAMDTGNNRVQMRMGLGR